RTLRGCARKTCLAYRCEGYDEFRRRNCHMAVVRQDAVVGLLLRVVQEQFLNPDRLNELRAEIARQEAAEREPSRCDGLRAAVADLTQKIDHGRENLAVLPQDMIAGVVTTVRGWERERERLEADLARATTESGVEDFEAAVAAAEAMLWRLREAAADGDQGLVADLLRQVVERIEFRWAAVPCRRLTRYRLAGGVIHLRPDGLMRVGADGAESTS